jgi:Flp pilus assembly protein TadD
MSRKRCRREGLEKGGRDAINARAPSVAPLPDDAVEAIIARARKSWARADARRALVLLRGACALDEWRPRTWTILGARLALLGRADEAAQAFKQARWLRLRAGDRARVGTIDRLLAELLPAAA